MKFCTIFICYFQLLTPFNSFSYIFFLLRLREFQNNRYNKSTIKSNLKIDFALFKE